MTRHRRPAAGALVALLLVTAGCIGFLTGEEALEFEASPATVSDGALSETGYERTNSEAVTLNRTFEAAGQSRDVTVTNHVTQYGRTVDLQVTERRAAVFVLLSTPQVKVLDRTFNPVGEMSNRELLKRLQSRYDQIEVGPKVGETTVTTLGSDTTVEKFSGKARIGGTNVDIYIHVTKLKHEGDFVVAVGVYPQALEDEEGRILTLIRNVRHGG